MNLAHLAVTTGGLAAVCLLGGCRRAQIENPAFDPQAAAEQAMRLYDANKDGQLSRQELTPCPGLAASAKHADTNRDDALSAEEIAARIETYVDIQLALFPYECQVYLDNRPLQGATVKLVPEEFLEGMVRPAEGVTDESGSV